MKELLKRFVREEEGQDLIEYALLAAFISLVVVGLVVSTGTSLNSVWGNIDSAVANAAGQGS